MVNLVWADIAIFILLGLEFPGKRPGSCEKVLVAELYRRNVGGKCRESAELGVSAWWVW